MTVGGLAGLTLGKTIANTGLRWIPFFLPNLGRALGASTSALTSVLGLGELAGLLTLAAGRSLDRGRERAVMTVGMALVGISTILAIVGSLVVFAIGQFLLTLGVALYTVGGHAFISRHVSFSRRGRSIGIFEVSWALGLLVGAPAAALMIEYISWRAPFVAIGVLAFVACGFLLRVEDRSQRIAAADPNEPKVRLNANAWYAVGGSAGIALAGLTTIVIVGTWLEDKLDVSTGGIGVVAMGFGAVELLSSTTSASFSDRLGKNRSTRGGLVLVGIGLVIMGFTSDSLVVGVIGLVIFFCGFEYAIVTSFSVVSEAMPTARGRVLAANVAIGTFARGAGSIASGFLYEAYGIVGPATLSGIGAAFAFGCLSRVSE